MINKFSFTIFHWQGFLVRVDDQQVSLDKFRLLKINNILATFSLLSVYTSKFLTWQFFLVKEKLARQIFLDKENLSTIPHLHEQFFLVKANLSKKNCSCKWGISNIHKCGKTIASKAVFNTKSTRQTMKTTVISGKRFILTRSSGLIG